MQLQGLLFEKVWVSQRSERRHQRGHSARLPSLVSDGGLGASESECSPSKNISSNFHKINSSGDAICLSIGRVTCAQVGPSYCSRHVSKPLLLLIHTSPLQPVFFRLCKVPLCGLWLEVSDTKSTFIRIFSPRHQLRCCIGNPFESTSGPQMLSRSNLNARNLVSSEGLKEQLLFDICNDITIFKKSHNVSHSLH